jgi:hypothetical protein
VRALHTVILLPFVASCSILDGFGFFAGPGPADGECTDQDPFCGSSDFVDVCDTYGGEIDDGNESLQTFSCVLPAQVSRGPCEDTWDLLTPNPREDARILFGFWESTAIPDDIVGRCFPGSLYVMTEDAELHAAMHELTTIDLAIDTGGPTPAVAIAVPIDGDNDFTDAVNSEEIPVLVLDFCVPDPSMITTPSAVTAMLKLEDGTTTERRCLDVFSDE